MSQVTFSAIPTVCITIRGESQEGGSHHYFPKDDEGIIGRYYNFRKEQKIFPNIRGGVSGPGIDISFFSPENAEKIVSWLRSQNIDEVEAQ